MPINGLTLLGGAAGNFVVWPPTPLGAWGAHLPAFLPAHARSSCHGKCVSSKTEAGTLSCLTQTGESSASVSF